jgi:hypothetical protein
MLNDYQDRLESIVIPDDSLDGRDKEGDTDTEKLDKNLVKSDFTNANSEKETHFKEKIENTVTDLAISPEVEPNHREEEENPESLLKINNNKICIPEKSETEADLLGQERVTEKEHDIHEKELGNTLCGKNEQDSSQVQRNEDEIVSIENMQQTKAEDIHLETGENEGADEYGQRG